MIRINLLPHREERRKAQQIRFMRGSWHFCCCGAVCCRGGIQRARTTHLPPRGKPQRFLKAEIDQLDKQIAEIEVLRTKRKDLLDRKQVVEKLQANRGEMVRMLDQLTRQTPEGIYLISLKHGANLKDQKTGNPETTVRLLGRSLSNARISTLCVALMILPRLTCRCW